VILRYLITDNTIPYDNLALEELLLEQVKPGEVIFLLWQNRQAVVIGRNQNAWRECWVEQLEQDGGFLARRRSGGGAVFHDLGNLNFSFIASDADYNLSRQYDVIVSAMSKLGLTAIKNGRNDLLIDGRKFSGNAFVQTKGRNCHHGTILINTDNAKMERYLNVSPDKLQSKGVLSVKARTVNLCDFLSDLHVEDVRRVLLDSFAEIYGGVPQRVDEANLSRAKLSIFREKFASWDWRFGPSIAFTQKMNHRFDWGEIELQIQVNEGCIQAVVVFTDALETELIEAMPKVLEGVPFSTDKMLKALSHIPKSDAQTRRMIMDMRKLIQADTS